MIELRWLQRPANIKDKHMIEDSCGYLMVLQYRRALAYEKIPDIGMVHERVSMWSEWIDVPTVTEGLCI